MIAFLFSALKSKFKILQIIPKLSAGGAERFVVDLSNELASDVSITIIVLYPKKESEFYYRQISPLVRVVNLSKKPGFDSKIFFSLKRVLEEEKPDIVHSHLRALTYLLPIIPFFRNIEFVHTVHSLCQ